MGWVVSLGIVSLFFLLLSVHCLLFPYTLNRVSIVMSAFGMYFGTPVIYLLCSVERACLLFFFLCIPYFFFLGRAASVGTRNGLVLVSYFLLGLLALFFCALYSLTKASIHISFRL